MNSGSVGAAIVVASLMVGVIVVYSIQSSPAHTFTSTTVLDQTSTVTVSGNVTTTTVLEKVEVVSATGSQAVLCTATNNFPPGTGTAIINFTTLTIGNSTTVESHTSYNVAPTYQYSSVYVSATNSTEPVGYVVSTTSQDSGYSGPAAPFTFKTCTYLP
jgi:hypothetical protein